MEAEARYTWVGAVVLLLLAALLASLVWLHKIGRVGDFKAYTIHFEQQALDGLQDVLGYAPQEYLADADFWRSRVHPDDLAEVEAQHASLRERQAALDRVGELMVIYCIALHNQAVELEYLEQFDRALTQITTTAADDASVQARKDLAVAGFTALVDADPSALERFHRRAAALVRACGLYSQLFNIAEDLHHARRRRAHQRAGSAPQRGSLSRVVWGCVTMLDPRNELVDPDADTIERAPVVARPLDEWDEDDGPACGWSLGVC